MWACPAEARWSKKKKRLTSDLRSCQNSCRKLRERTCKQASAHYLILLWQICASLSCAHNLFCAFSSIFFFCLYPFKLILMSDKSGKRKEAPSMEKQENWKTVCFFFCLQNWSMSKPEKQMITEGYEIILNNLSKSFVMFRFGPWQS